MKKVLIVATSRKTRGGITSVIKAHESGKQWKDFRCHWIQTHRDGSAWRKIAYLGTSLLDYVIRLPFYDIVHIHFSNTNSLRRKLFFAKLAHRFQKKIIVHFHAFDPDTTIHGPKKSTYRQLFEMADKAIVLSNWWKNELIKAFPNLTDDTIVLYNPCPEIGTDSAVLKEKIILYAGTVNARKGYADLIKAFAKISPSYPEWSLSIAGNGEIEEGKSLAASLGIGEKVNFLGWISGSEKDSAFRKASIFCLPSYAEGFPMAVLDAWAYGLPVVTTPVGGIPDIAEDGTNMLLFNPGDIDTLANKLESLIKDTDLRSRLSEESNKLASTTFSIDAVNAELGKIYSYLS